MKRLTAEKVAFDLFAIHTHGADPEEIVYRERDLIELFEKWGIPAPDWASEKYRSMFKRRKNKVVVVIEGKYTKEDMIEAILDGDPIVPQAWLKRYDAKKRKK